MAAAGERRADAGRIAELLRKVDGNGWLGDADDTITFLIDGFGQPLAMHKRTQGRRPSRPRKRTGCWAWHRSHRTREQRTSQLPLCVSIRQGRMVHARDRSPRAAARVRA
jgi:hypothetical protein